MLAPLLTSFAPLGTLCTQRHLEHCCLQHCHAGEGRTWSIPQNLAPLAKISDVCNVVG
jgi:hypothetical protein